MPIPTQVYKYLDYKDFGGGYNTKDNDTDVADNELTGGQNIDFSPDKALATRKGHTLYGNFIGTTTGILGLVTHEPAGGTAEFLAVYDTGVYRYVAGVWTALTSVTMTTNKRADSAHFPLTGKTYITNGTDNVVKYTSSTSGDQSDSSFKKGTYIIHYKNRLLTSIDNVIWYTDLGVDTFSANNYLKTEGAVTGLQVLYDKWLTFTKKKVYVTQNFTFDGVAAGPESFLPLRTDFGAIYDRTIATVNNVCYFLGQDSQGKCAVYATDGLSVVNISNKISPDLDAVAPAQLVNACAVSYGRFYRLSITPTGQTTNTIELLYDTIDKRWLPPYTNHLGGFSCYANFETSGELNTYAGTQSNGMVYKLNQADYDEDIGQSNIQVPDVHSPIDAASGAVKRTAQSFQLSVSSPRTMYVTGVAVMLKKNTGTTTGLTVNIETDSSGKPSGTLANANLTGTISAFTDTSYVWKIVKFATPALLSASTTYHLVVKHTTEGAGNSQYYMGMKGTASTYALGIASAYTSSAWANIANTDASFLIFTESDIESYGDTKAFMLSPQGQKTRMNEMFITASATGNYNIQIGTNTGEYDGFDYIDYPIAQGGPIFGSTFVIGTSVLGGTNRSDNKIYFNSKRGRTFKFRFRKRFANEPFTIYGFRTKHEIEQRFS